MFSIIHKEMQGATTWVVVVSVSGALIEKVFGKNELTLRYDAQLIIMLLLWFAVVAYRSVEKLAELE